MSSLTEINASLCDTKAYMTNGMACLPCWCGCRRAGARTSARAPAAVLAPSTAGPRSRSCRCMSWQPIIPISAGLTVHLRSVSLTTGCALNSTPPTAQAVDPYVATLTVLAVHSYIAPPTTPLTALAVHSYGADNCAGYALI